MPDLTIQDMIETDQVAGAENARPDNDGPIIGSIRPPNLVSSAAVMASARQSKLRMTSRKPLAVRA